jgi:hypothetical protein
LLLLFRFGTFQWVTFEKNRKIPVAFLVRTGMPV